MSSPNKNARYAVGVMAMILGLLAVQACTGAVGAARSGEERPNEVVRLLEVIDGDTIDVSIDGTKTRIRVIGGNTPEVYGGRECGGAEASAGAEEVLAVGIAELEADSTQADKDRFGRTLRHIKLSSGINFMTDMAGLGLAEPFVYQGVASKYADQIRAAADAAKAAGVGVWASEASGGCDGFNTRYAN